MSEANKNFHMAIAQAGKNPYLIAFYERLLDQGRRMLHMHFEFLERTPGSQMLTGEHDEMLAAIAARDADRADELAHAHTRQFRDNFMHFMSENYATNLSLSPTRAA
jgi:DNA-binding GntR family transcriptional regulator